MRLSFPVLALTVSLAFGLAACNDSIPGNDGVFSIVAGSENRDIEPLVREFCEKQSVACDFSYQGSLDIGLSLGMDAQNSTADAIWPAASIWVSMFDDQRKVRHLASIAQNPVALGVRKSKAQELGWIGRDVTMRDILAAVESGRLRFLMTSATQSNSGATAYLSMLTAMLGDKDVIQPGDLDEPGVRQQVQSLLRGVQRSSGSSGWLADLYVDSAKQGTLYDAMWNYEVTLKETNAKLAEMGQDPLYAIYPTDGVGVADSPLGFIDRGRGEKAEEFFKALQAHLLSAPVQERIAQTGRRLPLGSGSPALAPAEPAWNFDPSRLVTAIRMPSPNVIRTALDLYQDALRRPSLTAICLDFSGSMRGTGEEELQQALDFLLTPDKTRALLVQWSPADRIILLPFDQRVRTSFSSSGNATEQQGLRRSIMGQTPSGGTDIYACAADALRRIDAIRDGDYLPAIVLMTDGRSGGNEQAFLSQWRASGSRVPVFGITFGDADDGQLETLAAATSGRVFDGKADLAGAFRAVRGYN